MRHAQSCPWPLLHNLCQIVFNNENVQMKWRRPAVNYNGTSVEVSDKTPSKKASKDIQTQVQWLDSDFLRYTAFLKSTALQRTLKVKISTNPGLKLCSTFCIYLPTHCLDQHFVLSKLFFESKAQQYFVSFSYTFLYKKTLLKIWLRLG